LNCQEGLEKTKMNKNDIYTTLERLQRQKKGLVSFLTGTVGYSKKEAIKIVESFKASRTKPVFEHGVKSKSIDLDLNTSVNEDDWKGGLKFTNKYVYNKEDDKYVVYLKAANGNVVIPGTTMRGIQENYSNWYGNPGTIGEICRNYQIPKSYFNELKQIMGFTHNSEPFTNEQLIEKDVNELTTDVLEKKKFQLHQKVQKQSWLETESAAHRWHEFMEGTYNPMESMLSKWTPPAYVPIKLPAPSKNKVVGTDSMIVGLSDVHFGSYAEKNLSYRGKGNSTEETVKSIENYAQDIAKAAGSRNQSFRECVVTSLGDILHTTGQGFTTKGTPLSYDCLKEEQFNAAFDSLVKFISAMLEIFPKVRVKSVKGNHNDFGDYVLFKAMAAYFRTEERIDFEAFQSDHGLFKVNNTLFVISHGYSAEYKGRLPSGGKARESYIANLFLANPEALIGVKTKVLITADQHHLESKEYAEFDHYMLSTAVKGDQHSEALGLHNIPRQSCFVVGDIGISEIIYSYIR
jgi:hypothetical protein